MNQTVVNIDGKAWTIRELRVRDRISAASAIARGYGDGDGLVVIVAAGVVSCEGLDLPAQPHERMTAIEDSDIFEVSTPELDDVVRLEDRYGRIEK